MRHSLIAAAAAAGLALLATEAAQAQPNFLGPGRWCAVVNIGTGNVIWDCTYPSIEACRPNVIAGNRGFCNPNPSYAGPPVQYRKYKRKKHRRDY